MSTSCPTLSALPQAMYGTGLAASLVLNSMFNMGMSVAKEKMFNIADKTLNTTDRAKYFLYGGTKRRNTRKNSFIYRMLHTCKGCCIMT